MSLLSRCLSLGERAIVGGLRMIPPRTRGKTRLARLLLPLLAREGETIIALAGGERLLVPSVREPVAFQCLIDGIYEPELIGLLNPYLPRGGTFLDVGANVGVFTLAAARVAGPLGRVIAIEASPEVGMFLARNIAANDCRNVTFVAKAAADSGPRRLSFWPAPKEKFGMGALAPQFGVAGITLDAELDRQHPDGARHRTCRSHQDGHRGVRGRGVSRRTPASVGRAAAGRDLRICRLGGKSRGSAARGRAAYTPGAWLHDQPHPHRRAAAGADRAARVWQRQSPGASLRGRQAPRRIAPRVNRLAIFTTHPIQYQAPWFRSLAKAQDLEIKVMLSRVPDAKEQGAGFGTTFAWDIPLLTGYPHTVLRSYTLPERVPAYARRWSLGIGDELDRFRPHVAMVLGWQEISLVQALLACRRRRIPVVLRGESNALRPRPRLVSTLHRRLFSLCDAFLAIGHSNADLYRATGVPQRRIVTAGYFVDNDRFAQESAALVADRAAIRSAWAIPDDAVCLAFVGKLEPKKRVMDFLGALLDVAARGARVHGLVVGSGEQMDAARAMCLGHAAVTFAGFLNQTAIARAYVAADCLALPSDFGETWGLVVNEAMATGLPAIVSDHAGCANDLVVPGVTGLVFPFGDRVALAGAMEQVAADTGERLSLGAAARCHVHANFSIERATEELREAMAVAMAQRAPHAAA